MIFKFKILLERKSFKLVSTNLRSEVNCVNGQSYITIINQRDYLFNFFFLIFSEIEWTDRLIKSKWSGEAETG